MENASLYVTFAATALFAVAILATTGLKGLQAWIELKRAELEALKDPGSPRPTTSNRIEIADLKERIRKLEAIAAGVDL
jgi:uncharacterized protein YecT (DUF1311 family)